MYFQVYHYLYIKFNHANWTEWELINEGGASHTFNGFVYSHQHVPYNLTYCAMYVEALIS